MSNVTGIVTRDEDSFNIDQIPSMLSKISGTGLVWKKIYNCGCQNVVASLTWKGDPIISFCAGESVRKVNLCK